MTPRLSKQFVECRPGWMILRRSHGVTYIAVCEEAIGNLSDGEAIDLPPLTEDLLRQWYDDLYGTMTYNVRWRGRQERSTSSWRHRSIQPIRGVEFKKKW
jgi:hypothetical protein